MNSSYVEVCDRLRGQPRRWLVTGAAGFIGSNLVERLLELGQSVVGLDNFATGHRRNLNQVLETVGEAAAARFQFVEGDIRDLNACRSACSGVDLVLHQAALGSVPRSLADPVQTNEVNISGFLNILVAARDAGVKSFVYAASSSTYGDSEELPKREERIGRPLSPYAVTKYVNELYADVFARGYGFSSVGLRYFNVFGPRQDPDGAYAAVIPKWVSAMIRDEVITINGDGETSRDFCFIENVVQANLLAAVARDEARNEVYNVAVGDRTTLNMLFEILRSALGNERVSYGRSPHYGSFRAGDVRHSLADIDKARSLLGYEPQFALRDGMTKSIGWYVANLRPEPAQ